MLPDCSFQSAEKSIWSGRCSFGEPHPRSLRNPSLAGNATSWIAAPRCPALTAWYELRQEIDHGIVHKTHIESGERCSDWIWDATGTSAVSVLYGVMIGYLLLDCLLAIGKA